MLLLSNLRRYGWLFTVVLFAFPTSGEAASCPEGVVAQLNGLYKWHIAAQGRNTFPSQKSRFTPTLYGRIERAFALSPERDGRFVDFDIFSNTQVETYGADVLACYPGVGSRTEAIVAVQVGIRGVSSDFPMILRYRMIRSSRDSWRISNILWGENGGESQNLNRFLEQVLP